MDNKELDKRRAEFEAWASAERYFVSMEREPTGKYKNHGIQSDWEIWQAALARAGMAAPTEPTRDIQELVHYSIGSKSAAIACAAERVQKWLAAPTGQQAEPVADEWRVGEFWSSSRPGQTVLMISRGAKEISHDGAHESFVRWVGSSSTHDAAPAAQKEGTSEQDARDAERFRWIDNNCRTTGGGNGFTLTCFVPVDEEDIGCAIDAAMSAAQAQPKDTTKGQA